MSGLLARAYYRRDFRRCLRKVQDVLLHAYLDDFAVMGFGGNVRSGAGRGDVHKALVDAAVAFQRFARRAHM